MYSVFLADDEPIIIRGLKKMIPWKELNAQIIGEAYEGKETLAAVRKIKPDILISDISMPGMTGLEILKTIKEEKLETKVIFLSAFQEFNYAKDAITYGAVEYLLKPLEQQEFKNAVLKAEQVICKTHDLEVMTQAKDELQLIFNHIDGNYEDSELYDRFKEMGIDLTHKVFAGVCFSLGKPAQIEESKYELLRFAVFKRIQKHLMNQRTGFVIKRDDNSSNMIFILPEKSQAEYLKTTISEIISLIGKEYQVTLEIGAGDFISNLKDLKYAYKTAKFASEFHFFQSKEVIYYAEIKREFNRSINDYNEIYRQIFNAVLTKDQKFLQLMEPCITLIGDLHYGSRHAVINRCIQFSSDLFKDLMDYKLVSESLRSNYEAFMDELRRQDSFLHLKDVFCSFYKDFFKSITSDHNYQEAFTIIQVKQYIKDHFAEEISLSQMAKMVYMNPYYFSTFFKKETQQNFKNYVTQIRMKEALKLLKKTDMKTYELAKAVGYNDVRHFTDKFKETYGDSPAGYKKSLKKES